MSSARPVVYIDTCVVLAAHRAGCWNGLSGRYDLHTVQECWDELGRGNRDDPDYIAVDLSTLEAQVTVHTPSLLQVADAGLRSPKMAEIDAGERDLLAWCASQTPDSLLLTTGDRAAIVTACQLGLGDRLRSLEELATAIGLCPRLDEHYGKAWLSRIRTEFLLEEL